MNYNYSITSAHVNSYLSKIATRQGKDRKALRLLRGFPIYTTTLIHFNYTFFLKYVHIHEIALSNKILTIYMRNIFKYAYNPKHRCWTFEYIHTKSNILNTSNKMLSFFLLSIALSITGKPVPSTIHTVCKTKKLGWPVFLSWPQLTF